MTSQTPPGSAPGLSLPPPAQLPPLDAAAARVLHQALSELESVKKQLRQPFMSKATVEASISRLEEGLKAKSQEILLSSMSAPPRELRQSTPPGPLGVTFKPKVSRPLPPMQPSAAERVAMFKADPFNRPQTDAARQYLLERFGVPPPTRTPLSTERASGGGYGGPVGNMAKGTAAPHGVILPKQYRHDPYAVPPPEVADLELDKGLINLVNKGVLPLRADLTPALVGEAGPVKMAGAALNPFHAQFVRPAPTSALEDSLIAASRSPFKLDLLTPVVPPAPLPPPQHTLHAVQVGTMKALATREAEEAGLAGSLNAGDRADPRTYDALMDTFSLHQFMIRRGAVLDGTPEFESYQRTYEPLWEIIAPLILQLESLMSQYAVPLAIVDGKSLANLAHGILESRQQPQLQDLLLCIQNIQEVGALLRQPGRRFMGEQGKEDAATMIQAAWKGCVARRKFSKHGVAASVIQAVWRMHRLRRTLLDKLRAARRDRDARFQALQQQLYQQWPLMQRNTHIVVHLPSTYRREAMTPAQRDAMLAREAAQLARLCDLSEPLVEILLVLPEPPDSDVIAYWDKILEVGGVSEPGSRYRVLWPENHARLPLHMSPAGKVLSSPRALQRLQAALHGRMGYLVPGLVSEAEVDLAVQLGIPMLGPTPYTARTLGRKSAARALFRAAGALIPPGLPIPTRDIAAAKEAERKTAVVPGSATPEVLPLRSGTDFRMDENGDVVVVEPDIRPPPPTKTQFELDEARLLLIIAEAMVLAPTISKWLLKVDDEIMGCGHAFFDTLAIKGAADVLERVAMEHPETVAASSGQQDPLTPLSEPQKVAVYRMNELLYRQLSRKLSLAAREVYLTYRDFMSALAVRGGVVEAAPAMAVGSPSVNLFIAPTGEVSVLSTHERIFASPYRAVGNTFPQSTVPHRALADASTSIGAACYRAGLVGHACVDFVTHQEEGGSLRLWAVDIDTNITPSLVSFQIFDFLTVGTFNPLTGTYCVEVDEGLPEDSETASQAPGSALVPERLAGTSGSSGIVEAAAAAAGSSGVVDALAGLHPASGGGGSAGSAGAYYRGATASAGGASVDSARAGTGNSGGAGARAWTPDGLVQPWGDGEIQLLQEDGAPGSLPGSQPVAAGGSGSSGRGRTGDGPQDDDDDMRALQAAAESAPAPLPPQPQRTYFAIDALHHPGIAASSCSKFFHRCWQEGFHFDVDNRTGVIFNLSDKYLLGSMGFITVGVLPHEAYCLMQAMLSFVVQREIEMAASVTGMSGPAAGARRAGANVAAAAASGGLSSFKDVQALVKYMAEQSMALAGMPVGMWPQSGAGAGASPQKQLQQLHQQRGSTPLSTHSSQSRPLSTR